MECVSWSRVYTSKGTLALLCYSYATTRIPIQACCSMAFCGSWFLSMCSSARCPAYRMRLDLSTATMLDLPYKLHSSIDVRVHIAGKVTTGLTWKSHTIVVQQCAECILGIQADKRQRVSDDINSICIWMSLVFHEYLAIRVILQLGHISNTHRLKLRLTVQCFVFFFFFIVWDKPYTLFVMLQIFCDSTVMSLFHFLCFSLLLAHTKHAIHHWCKRISSMHCNETIRHNLGRYKLVPYTISYISWLGPSILCLPPTTISQ